MKKVSYWAFHAISPAISGLRRKAEMFGQLCRLQTHTFFSIGHSFAALAFCRFSRRKTAERKKLAESAALSKTAMCRCSSNLLVRAA
jgi:hypothetical protein